MNVKGSIEGDDKTDMAFEELQSEMAQAFEQSFQHDDLSDLKERAALGEGASANADPQSEDELPAAVDEMGAPDAAASADAAANNPASEPQLTSHTQSRLAALSSFVGLFGDAQAHLKEIDSKLQEVATSHHLTREFFNVLFADTHRANQLELANTRLTLEQRKLTDQLHELGKTRQELERALEARQQREAGLDRDNEALRAALAASQLDLVEAANATAKNEAELGEAIKALSVRSVEAERSSRENEVLREKHLNLSIEFDKALSREADARRKFDEVSALHDNEATRNTELLSAVGKSEIEVLRLKKSLETAHMKLAEMADEARIVEAEGEADAVRNAAELSGLRSELQSLQARLDHAHGEHSETAAEMAQLKAQLSDTITQKLIADEKLSTLMEENERDKINLSAASTNFSELSLQQASDQIQYEVLTQECEDLRAEVVTLNARVKELLPYERLHRVTNARQNEGGGARIDIQGVETDANLGVGRNKAGSGRIRAV